MVCCFFIWLLLLHGFLFEKWMNSANQKYLLSSPIISIFELPDIKFQFELERSRMFRPPFEASLSDHRIWRLPWYLLPVHLAGNFHGEKGRNGRRIFIAKGGLANWAASGALALSYKNKMTGKVNIYLYKLIVCIGVNIWDNIKHTGVAFTNQFFFIARVKH